MRTNCLSIMGLSVVGSTFLVSVAEGQTAESPASLFERAVPLLEAGDFAAACPLIQESYDREPKDGRLVALAKCRDGEGKMATALEFYRAYLRPVEAMDAQGQGKHAPRVEIAKKRVQSLETMVPKLKLVWRGEVPTDVVVEVGGVDARTQINAEWPLDPGEHVVTIRRHGSEAESRSVTLEVGKPLVEVDLTPVVVREVTPENPKPQIDAPDARPVRHTVLPQGRSNSRRIAGSTLLGIGGVGLAVGAVLGGMALHEKGFLDAKCVAMGDAFRCQSAGKTAMENTLAWGNASTVAFVMGGMASIIGFALVVKSPKETTGMTAHVVVSDGSGFVLVKGNF